MPGADSIISAFVAGRQLLDQQRRRQQEDEDRALEREGLQIRLKALKLEERMRARGLAKDNFEMLEGRPESELLNVRQPGQAMPANAVTTMNEAGLPTQATRKTVTIPGIEELGVGDVTMQPQSMEDILRARAAEERRRILETPREVGGRLVTPEGPDGKSVVHYEPPAAPKAVTFKEPVLKLINGRPGLIVHASDNQWYLPGTSTPFTGRVEPLPKEEKPTDEGPTRAQRSTAERWKFGQLKSLEDAFKKSQSGGDAGFVITGQDGSTISLGGSGKRPMTTEELNASKLAIENAYRLSIGLSPLNELPASWNASKGAAQPATKPAAAPAAAAGGGQKTVTQAELAAIAQRRGTTVDQEKKRAAAEGFVVR
ncbi:MAG TPA: hypothetical protein VEA16_00695 [Vicinamibacterales bacterium]|nr:hypothetical protein [Vicinamibacterales bacterium]